MNEFDLVADLTREFVRGTNQYAHVPTAARLATHLAGHHHLPLFVGESPATDKQAVAFTDDSRSSKVFNTALADAKVARWNAWPFVLPRGQKPTADELRRGAEYLAQLVQILQPHRVVAVGRTAERCCKLARVKYDYVPHPGQDKARDFTVAVRGMVEDWRLAQ